MFYIQQKYSSSSYNGGINFTKDMINNIPIKNEVDVLNSIGNISKQIVEIKSQNLNDDVIGLETQIDKIVYELYGLTEEEIAIVEKSFE